jgi:hypothetical protein
MKLWVTLAHVAAFSSIEKFEIRISKPVLSCVEGSKTTEKGSNAQILNGARRGNLFRRSFILVIEICLELGFGASIYSLGRAAA